MKISVLICNYNHGKFVEQAIRGVLQQTHRDIEVVVIDDASTDNSLKVIIPIAREDRRIRLEMNEENMGLLRTFEKGIGLCSGELWMGCGADDYVVDPNFFEECDRLLSNKKDAGGVFGISQRINAESGALFDNIGCGEKVGFIEPQNFIQGFFTGKNFVPGFSVMWRSAMLREVGGFAMNLGPQFDYWVNHALPSLRGIFFTNTIVSTVRIFPDGSNFSSQKEGDRVIRLQRHAKFEKRLLAYTGFKDDPLVTKWRTQLIYDLCDGKDVEGGWKTYMEELIK